MQSSFQHLARVLIMLDGMTDLALPREAAHQLAVRQFEVAVKRQQAPIDGSDSLCISHGARGMGRSDGSLYSRSRREIFLSSHARSPSTEAGLSTISVKVIAALSTGTISMVEWPEGDAA